MFKREDFDVADREQRERWEDMGVRDDLQLELEKGELLKKRCVKSWVDIPVSEFFWCDDGDGWLFFLRIVDRRVERIPYYDAYRYLLGKDTNALTRSTQFDLGQLLAGFEIIANQQKDLSYDCWH